MTPEQQEALEALDNLEKMVKTYDLEPDLTPFLKDVEAIRKALGGNE